MAYAVIFAPIRGVINSRGLRPGSKARFENMNDWQYLSQGDLKQNEFFPKSKS